MTERNHEIKKMIGRTKNMTWIGYYLRRYKIDELPQLINVLFGKMSLVGPRPSIRDHLNKMSEKEKKRYTVRPGMTGLAQVSGNIHIDWQERYKFDLHYVNNISFMNDIKILSRTVMLVLTGEKKYVNEPLEIRITNEV